MKFISHRGNLIGPDKEKENTISYIKIALDYNFDVEIDIWFDNGFWLGHDNPETKINAYFLQNPKLWCHAKNIEALYELSKINTRYFWHQNDDYTLTSDNFIWTYPNKKITQNSICLFFNIDNLKDQHNALNNCAGVCSDYISLIKNRYEYNIS